MRKAIRVLPPFLIPASLFLLTGCHLDMWAQPKVKPLQESEFFSDKQASRPVVTHTVARGHLRLDDALYTGFKDKKLIADLPIPLTMENLKRGQERFNIYCSPCHSRLGDGKGMIAQRGLALRRQPATYHTERLRKMPIGHFYDVITNGYGVMYSYAARVEPEDRWRIAAYIRALQYSQSVPESELSPQDVEIMKATGKPSAEGHSEHE